MDVVDKYSYWEDAAEYDLETAEAMLNSGRYLYVVFMCQQAVEKITKGLFVLYNGEEPPRTHNILSIFEKIQFKGVQPTTPKLDEYKGFFEELLAFYISERYPSYKEKISTTIDQKSALEVLTQTREVFAWLKSLKI
ncbi:MAG: HEPN domain-containing protein [Firmicutes bacterium]|nr:HEPN domain-containing protein [Bacillota bacterium]